MRRFAELFHALDTTGSTGEKVELLAEYFASASDADGAWALALLTGNRPKGAATTAVLKRAAMQSAGIPEWLLKECHTAVGDLSEAVALVLPFAGGGAVESLERTVTERVLPLRGADEAGKVAILSEAWRAFGVDERIVYHKLIRGGFRVGVQKRLVVRGLAKAFDMDPDVIEHRMMGGFEPTPQRFRAIVSGERDEDHKARGYPFYLAHPLGQLSPSEVGLQLGPAPDWIAEWKWDGIRAQLVWRDGAATLWSRGGGLISEQFPELIEAARLLPRGTVLDGEVLLWRGDRARPFAALQTRLNRTVAPTHQLSLFDDTRVVMMVYDLIERDGVDLRQEAFGSRRAKLQALIDSVGLREQRTIMLSPLVPGTDWERLASERAKSRSLGVEGLMLKHRASMYGVGRARSDSSLGWRKWKIEPFTADAVLVGAQPGSGRRASLYTDYTFAVWDRPGDADADKERALLPFAKAYSGLTQEQIERLDAWIRSNTTMKRGPFRRVRPEQVFELAFESVQVSDRHKSGLAVRFPRIKRWREDKPVSEADHLETLRALLGGAS